MFYKILNFLKIGIIIQFLFNINPLLLNVNNLIYYLQLKNEIKKIEKYFMFCSNLKKIKKFKKMSNPKVSIISPVFNREKFLTRFISSIQYQTYSNIEIIFVDDGSIDDSASIIKQYKKEDERIILIKNKKNKGTFKARNIGVIYSIGKYIIIPDPDDILSKDIINTCYNYVEKFNYEIIRFNVYKGNGKIVLNKHLYNLLNKMIYQPKLSAYIYYGNNELETIDSNIYNKFIKREVYIKSLNKLSHFYLNMHMTYMEDSLMNYILLKNSNNLYFITKIGYYYLKNSISITKNLFKLEQIRIKYIFIYLKLIFEYSKNTKYEKDMANLRFTKSNEKYNIIKFLPKTISLDDYIFYNVIIKMYLKCNYITKDNKYLLQDLKVILNKNFRKKIHKIKYI